MKSLGASDKATAEVFASDAIRDHKVRVLAAHPRFVDAWHHMLEPGREHAGENGERIIATDKELVVIGHNGAISRTEPNGFATRQLLDRPMGAVPIGDNTPRPLPAALRNAGVVINLDRLERPKVPTKGDDDEIVEASPECDL